jgi:phosphoenolpyruvate synthase/pyruvate phosphate dikinase
VVQEMIFADVAGVAFSVNPLTQNINEILVNAVYGLGESIVSGTVTPDQYLLHKTGRILNQTHETQLKGLFQKKGKLIWEGISRYKQNKTKLSPKMLLELCAIVTKIEKFYGFPVDVEFAVKKQKIYILQARPITTLNDKPKDYRVPKSFERPSLALFAQDGFEGLMAQTKLIEKYFKYPYVEDTDVAVYAKNYLCYSRKFTLECRDAYYWAYKRHDFSAFFKVGQICRRNYRFYQKTLAQYQEKIPTPVELEKMLNVICERMHFEMVFVDMLMDLSDIVSADLLNLLLQKKIPDITAHMLILSANEELTRVELENQSMQVILEIARAHKSWQTDTKINQLIDKHLEKFSGITVRAMHGQFMTKDDVIHRLKENLQSHKDFFSKDVAKDRKAVQSIFKKYRFSAFEKEFIAFVKEANFLRTHILDMYHWLSQNFMAIFDKIGQPYGYNGFDFRNMTPEEIISWYYGKSPFKLRDDGQWLWYRFGDERKVVDTPQAIEQALKQFVLPDKKTEGSACLVKGTGAYAGTVHGPARILKDISEVKKVCRGDVIICPMTWPSVIIALEKAIAFVTDEGGVLCHAAILARELKKTCVTGTKNATALFHDGDMVEVDGETGVVRKI